jgi:hypothetical protein
LSGIKINFTKYELVPLNLSDTEESQLADQLGCKISALPLMYLDTPLHWKKLTAEHWNFLIEKIKNKLQS